MEEENTIATMNNEMVTDYVKTRLIDKLKDEFTTDEAQVLAFNFKCYLQYKPTEFVIDLHKAYEWMGFTRVDNVKRMLIKTFEENVDYCVTNSCDVLPLNSEEQNSYKNVGENRGGHNKEIILMTTECFKQLCMISQTEKSKNIRKYYVKMERIFLDVVNEEFKIKMYEKDQLLHDQQQMIKNIINDKHKALLELATGPLVYFIQITPNLLKFGRSTDLNERFNKHKTTFGKDIEIVHIQPTEFDREVETELKTNPLFKQNIKSEIFKSKNQTELMVLDDVITLDFIKQFVLSVHNRLKMNKYNLITTLQEKAEEHKKNEALANQMTTIQKNNEIAEELMNTRIRDHQTYGHLNISQFVYQVYNPTTLKFVKTLGNIRHVRNEKELFQDARKDRVVCSCKENVVYKGYRFHRFLPNTFDDLNTEFDIPPTVDLKSTPVYDQVVQLDMNETKIIKIFSCSTAAAESIQPQHPNIPLRSITKFITNNLSELRSAYNFKWRKLTMVRKDLIDTYKANGGIIPKLKITKCSKHVYKYDEDNDLVAEYDSIVDALKEEPDITDFLLRKHLKNGQKYNGFYYRHNAS